jgi:hypothetical protein
MHTTPIENGKLIGGPLDANGQGIINLPESTEATAPITWSQVDTDANLAANSDTLVPTQKAVKTALAAAVTGLLDLKGSIDASGNPNYPAAYAGDSYFISADGKVGGASGRDVVQGGLIIAVADNAGGSQAGAGASWMVLQNAGIGVSASLEFQFSTTHLQYRYTGSATWADGISIAAIIGALGVVPMTYNSVTKQLSLSTVDGTFLINLSNS